MRSQNDHKLEACRDSGSRFGLSPEFLSDVFGFQVYSDRFEQGRFIDNLLGLHIFFSYVQLR